MKKRAQETWKKIAAGIDRTDWLPALLSRVAVGIVFAESGWGKLRNLPRVIEFFAELGIPLARVQAPFVAGVELVCGILLLLGLAARAAALPLAATMVVAIITAKRSEIGGLTDLFSLSEFLFLVILAWIAVFGPGAVSLDARLGGGRPRR